MKRPLFSLAIIFISSALLLLSACSEGFEGETPTNGTASMDGEKLYRILSGNSGESIGQIFVQNNRMMWQDYRIFDLDGFIIDSSDSLSASFVDGGTATISDIQVISDPNFVTPFYYHEERAAGTGEPLPTFGGTSTWGLAGNASNGIPAWSTTMYVPELITIDSPDFSDFYNPIQISKSQGFQITWNADQSNNLGVLVVISHAPEWDGGSMEHTAPDVYKVSSDNGSYTVTSADLQNIPIGSSMRITLIRGNYKDHTVDAKEFIMYATTASTGRGIVTN